MAQLAITTLGLLAGLFVRRAVAPPLGLPRVQSIALFLGALIGAAIGAKLPFLFLDLDATLDGRVWITDGRTLTWGLAFGYFGVEIAKWAAGVTVKTGDSFAPAVAASIAIGRIGCFVGGCCFGVVTDVPWAVDFGDGVHRHPTQLYESAFHALACVALIALQRRGLFERQRMKLYVLAYMLYRFVTEWLRPEPRIALGLTFYQWSALAFAAIFAALLWFDARAARADTSRSRWP